MPRISSFPVSDSLFWCHVSLQKGFFNIPFFCLQWFTLACSIDFMDPYLRPFCLTIKCKAIIGVASPFSDCTMAQKGGGVFTADLFYIQFHVMCCAIHYQRFLDVQFYQMCIYISFYFSRSLPPEMFLFLPTNSHVLALPVNLYNFIFINVHICSVELRPSKWLSL